MDAAHDERYSQHEDHEGHEGFGYFAYKLRALRVLRGQICFFGCGLAALGSLRPNILFLLLTAQAQIPKT
jgi:hypothetical protein